MFGVCTVVTLTLLKFCTCFALASGITRGLSQRRLFTEGNPLVTAGGPLTTLRKKKLLKMVNPNVNGYTKTFNHLKILQKTQKTTTY